MKEHPRTKKTSVVAKTLSPVWDDGEVAAGGQGREKEWNLPAAGARPPHDTAAVSIERQDAGRRQPAREQGTAAQHPTSSRCNSKAD